MSNPVVTNKQQSTNIIIKCAQDPVYFMKNYCYIQHPKRGRIRFDTFPFQDDCLKQFHEHRFNIILKSRQLGLSTLVAAYCLWLAIFTRDKSILVIATKLEVAMNFMRKVKYMKDSLPRWLLMPSIKSESKKEIQFSNNSSIKAIPTSEDAGRSEALSLLIVDEAAFIDGFDEIYKGIIPTLSEGGRAILLSSPRGTSGVFYETWVDAEAGKNEFNPIKLRWDVHPERDAAWLATQTANMSQKAISQEYLVDFQTSGETFFDTQEITWVKSLILPPIEKIGESRDIWIWKYAVPSHRYVMSSDVSRGNAKDYSTFHIVDIEENEVVAEFQGKIPPEKFSGPLVDVAKLYNNAVICQERNVYGYTVGVDLLRSGYPNLYYGSTEKLNFEGSPPPTEDEVPGLDTGAQRSAMLEKLDSMLRTRTLKIYSSRFTREMETFVWRQQKAQHTKSTNDDLVMSLAINVWIYNGHRASTQQSIDMARAMLSCIGRIDQKFTPPTSSPTMETTMSRFGGFTRNNSMPAAKSDLYKNALKDMQEAKPTQAPNSQQNAYSWLFGENTKPSRNK